MLQKGNAAFREYLSKFTTNTFLIRKYYLITPHSNFTPLIICHEFDFNYFIKAGEIPPKRFGKLEKFGGLITLRRLI